MRRRTRSERVSAVVRSRVAEALAEAPDGSVVRVVEGLYLDD